MSETPRPGETWERVRDGRRVEVESHIGSATWDPDVGEDFPNRLILMRWPHGRITTRWADRFLREFRRVTPSEGRET